MFKDRNDAGRRLAERLKPHRGEDIVVLGLPRGGVPVAYEVADVLGAPLDVIVVRKLGVPYQPEIAMGAIGENGARVVDDAIVAGVGVTPQELGVIERRERALLESRVARYRRDRGRIDLTGKVALIVDDGMATGATARAACRVARRLGASKVLVAVPVASCAAIRAAVEADEVVCLSGLTTFEAVSHEYSDFSPTSDDEVVALLDLAARRAPDRVGVAAQRGSDIDVEIPVPGASIHGRLYLPAPVAGVVLFAHGSGSSRHSPRNRFVASVLRRAGLGTLLIDLLTPGEESSRVDVHNVDLLSRRLTAATEWLRARPATTTCRIGYFGASTGAAAALVSAAQAGSEVSAVVSRGGRPDLAGSRLAEVSAPTLLIVGGSDQEVLSLNREAMKQLRCPARLVVVDGATHLFEEPGALADVALLASDWFGRHLLTVGLAHGRLVGP